MSREERKTRFANAWSEARAIIWANRKRLALGLVLILVNRLCGFVLPASSKPVVDRIIIGRDLALLWPIATIAIIATVVQAATSFSLSQLLGVAAQRVIMQMRKRVQQHVVRLPTPFFDSTKTGVLISRIMTDAEGIRNLVGTGIVQVTGGLFTAAISLCVLFYLSWQITVIILVIMAIFGLTMAYAFSSLRPIFRERSVINARVTGRLAETISGIRIVKGYTAERREDMVFAKGAHELFRNIAKSVTGVSAVGALTSAIIGVVGVIMIVMGAHAVIGGKMTEGDLIMYMLFTGMTTMPLIQIASITTQFSEAFAGLDRIRDLRAKTTEDEEDVDRGPLPAIEGHIRFEDVWFSYLEGVPVLKGISFDAPAGTTTALVGSSGSGKSTLLGLVMAFHRPQRGVIRVDGIDMNTLRLREYRSRLGIVLQENFLFDGTIAENIAFAKPNATREEIERVSHIAHCDVFVNRFEDGYDTVVGERGVKLSGGERQRIAIARAILADPKILILDEATSNLDSESEAFIQDGLRSLRAGRTTFVIAHRLSTIRSADQILVIEDGQIVERGTHHELLEYGGRYKELYDRQYQIEQNLFINPGEDFTPEPEEAR